MQFEYKGLGDALFEIEDVKGTEPVRRTTIIPKVSRVIPKDLEKYSSRTCSRVSWAARRGRRDITRGFPDFG